MVHNAAKTLIKGTAGASGHSMKQPYPNTPGGHGVGRVAASGPDTTAPELLRPGQLVIFDPLCPRPRREDGDVAILHGAFDGLDERTGAFARDSWRNGCWAEYVRAPLENTWPVGETVVVTPATGLFSGAAAVVAVSRSADKLARMEGIYPGLRTVVAGKTGNLTCGYCRPRPCGRCCGFQPPWRDGFRVSGPADSFPPAVRTSLSHWWAWRCRAAGSPWLHGVQGLGSGGLVLKLGKPAGLEVIASYPLERMDEALDKGLETGASELVAIGPQ
ncbi:isopropanol dehydrogenase, partial [Metarhizium majus ARSEF 297]